MSEILSKFFINGIDNIFIVGRLRFIFFYDNVRNGSNNPFLFRVTYIPWVLFNSAFYCRVS